MQGRTRAALKITHTYSSGKVLSRGNSRSLASAESSCPSVDPGCDVGPALVTDLVYFQMRALDQKPALIP